VLLEGALPGAAMSGRCLLAGLDGVSALPAGSGPVSLRLCAAEPCCPPNRGTQSSLSDLLCLKLEEAPGSQGDVVEFPALRGGLEHAPWHGWGRGFPLPPALLREIHARLLARVRADRCPGSFAVARTGSRNPPR